MRGLFGIVGLLVVVAIVGVLAKKQLAAGDAPRAGAAPGAIAPAVSPQGQVQQVEQGMQGAIQARPMPDAEK